ncbi:MAG: ATP-binding cassette domain-containing protein, partial [Actinomycetota bacterium]
MHLVGEVLDPVAAVLGEHDREAAVGEAAQLAHQLAGRVVVDPGRIVVLEGPSGGGKTTLLRVLAGLAPAFHGGEAWGAASVAGLDLRTAAPGAIAQRVGFLFQESEAQGVMTEVLRDVAFGLQC